MEPGRVDHCARDEERDAEDRGDHVHRVSRPCSTSAADRPGTLQKATLAVHRLDHCVCRRQGVGLNPNLLMKAIGETDVGFPRFGRHAFLLAMWLRFLAADGKVVLDNLP